MEDGYVHYYDSKKSLWFPVYIILIVALIILVIIFLVFAYPQSKKSVEFSKKEANDGKYFAISTNEKVYLKTPKNYVLLKIDSTDTNMVSLSIEDLYSNTMTKELFIIGKEKTFSLSNNTSINLKYLNNTDNDAYFRLTQYYPDENATNNTGQ